MFISNDLRLKKRLVVLVCFLTAVFSLSIFAARGVMTDTLMKEKTAYTLVIDAGHGGIDCGALAADGSRESDINLTIAQKLRALAEFYALDNAMIRQDDTTKSTSEEYSEHSDLVHRVELVNAESNPVLISIHQNSYPTGQPSGPQVIYALSGGSEAFGKLTHANLITMLDPQNRRVAMPDDGSLYMLSHLECPAILVECGFMSNFSDIERLKSTEYQTALSAVLAASYIQYSTGTIHT